LFAAHDHRDTEASPATRNANRARTARELLERRRRPGDRRNHGLQPTESGLRLLRRIRAVAVEREAEITAGLNPVEHAELTGLLRKVADHQGLAPGAHPGYRTGCR
jgi:DNA-binding MarR family transcriptional regulator